MLVVAAGAGCWMVAALRPGERGEGDPPPAPPGRNEAEVRLEPAPALTAKPEQEWRWRDANDNPYSEAFRAHFTYEGSEVTVRFRKAAPDFECRVRARKMKPNFAYQVKLVGMPRSVWGERGDAASNHRIGELGRWWRRGADGGNIYFMTDADKDEMEAYLLFGYFMTDADGSADATVRLDSSYHVLWKTSQWPAAKEDSAPTKHTIVAKAGQYGYDQDHPPGEIELYAEAQYGRPPKGTVRLPAGRYRCFLLLTEESFHAWGGGDGGDWAAALAATIEFTITAPKATGPRGAE
jgi:hypothetical protein